MKSPQQLLTEYAASGCEASFQSLVESHINLVWSAAFRTTHDAEAARDIAQIVFTQLARKASSLQHHPNITGWLHRAATQEALKWNRLQARRVRREENAMEPELASHPTEDSPDEHLVAHVDQALNVLPEKDRQAILLRYFENLSFTRISELLQITDDAAQKRVSRALEKLRLELSHARKPATLAAIGVALSAAASQAAPTGIAAATAQLALQNSAHSALFSWILLMKSKTALIASLGTLTLTVLLTIPAPAPAVRIKEAAVVATGTTNTAAATAAPAGTKNATTKPIDWSQVESPDYRQYIANLRAIGCPQQMIEDIIVSDLSKLYSRRIREITQRHQPQWWQKDRSNASAFSPTELAKIKELREEENAVCEQLLGFRPDKQVQTDRTHLQADRFELQLSFLPADKWIAARDALAHAGVRESDVSDDSNDRNFDKVDRARFERRAVILENMLTPEELTEYRRRCRFDLDPIYQLLAKVDVTSEEFDQIARIYEPRLRAGRAQLPDLRAILGPEKYQQFLNSNQKK